MMGAAQHFRRKLLGWFDRYQRDLPWRRSRDPYHVLVSEAMLQQTQVATVIPYFERFLKEYPTISHLAEADEQDVLRQWQGLGYYSRARNLQRAAKQIVSEHDGELPRTVDELLKLPGVGRYTAGAVASIAFGRRAPIVDGNVARVLCRIDKIESDPRETQTQQQLWRRAEEILPANVRCGHCGDFNSAMMELGATVCTPRSPKCLICPVRTHCEAQAAGIQERIPPPRKAKLNPLLRRDVLCIERNGRWLIEQRPATGRWAGMWQFVTVQTMRTKDERFRRIKRLGVVSHGLTHRRYEFRVFRAQPVNGEIAGGDDRRRQWVTLSELDRFPLPRPHLKVAQLLQEHGGVSS